MLKRTNQSIEGFTVSVSGSGNVAQYAIEKCMQLGAKVITVSDSHGAVIDKAGFTQEKLRALIKLKNERSEEHTSELQSLMRISYAVFCLKTKKKKQRRYQITQHRQ